MRIDRFLTRELKCSNAQARALLSNQKVRLDDAVVTHHRTAINAFTWVEVEGQCLQRRLPRYVMLHKPAGVVSATRDAQHRTVLDLLNEPYVDELHIAGRLDATSTGLLLLTNDGAWSKRLTLSQHKVPKVYYVETSMPIPASAVARFHAGFWLATEGVHTLPVELVIVGERQARLTLYEGRYHQIRRMFAQINNRVVRLHREQVGRLNLAEAALPLGDYCLVQPDAVW